MSGLPLALAPWAAQLTPFAPDLALVLGGFARRIAAALGPLPARAAIAGEPDGVDGLSRRGAYDRLLLTEWLLAEELPDEFIRRAAASEHLFLDRGSRGQGVARRSIALLDAGPDQLGSPRIAQLALLVVLASRAEAAGLALEWGIAQEPSSGLAQGFGADLARRLLDARTEQPPSAALLAQWSPKLPQGCDDLWFVGGPGLLSLAPPGASRLLAEDVTDPSVRQVRLALVARGIRRELILELPPRSDCTRLLRDPFHSTVVEPTRAPGKIVAEAGVVFAANGRHAVVRLQGGDLLDVHIPNSPRAPAGRARRIAGQPGLLGLGCGGKKPPLTVSVQEGALAFKGRRRSVLIQPGPGACLPSIPTASEPIGVVHVSRGEEHLWVLDSARVLHQASLPGGPFRVASAGVPSFVSSGDFVAYVACCDGELELVIESPSSRRSEALGHGSGRAFVSAPWVSLLVAAELAPGGTWTVRERSWAPGSRMLGVGRLLCPPAGTEVIGVTLGPSNLPGLLLLEADRRNFTLLDRTGLRPAFEAAGVVAAAAVSPRESTIGYTTRGGELLAFSLRHQAALLHLVPGAAP